MNSRQKRKSDHIRSLQSRRMAKQIEKTGRRAKIAFQELGLIIQRTLPAIKKLSTAMNEMQTFAKLGKNTQLSIGIDLARGHDESIIIVDRDEAFYRMFKPGTKVEIVGSDLDHYLYEIVDVKPEENPTKDFTIGIGLKPILAENIKTEDAL